MNTTILLGTLIYFGILSYSVKTNTPVRKIAYSIFVAGGANEHGTRHQRRHA